MGSSELGTIYRRTGHPSNSRPRRIDRAVGRRTEEPPLTARIRRRHTAARCLLNGDLEAFRRAARLSFTMWGGRYNPLIPVDTRELAGALVKLFRVDALVPMSQGAEVPP